MTSVDLAEFTRDAQAHIARLRETKTPETLTVDGEVAVVVQDARSYEAMLDQIEKAELMESLRQAIKDSDAGKGIPIEEAFARLDARYGV